MHIGQMTERVVIQQDTLTADGSGGNTTATSTLATVWAHIGPYKGAEILRAQAVASQIQHLVTLYYRADVTAKMRLLWTPTRSSSAAQRTLEILAVRPAADPLFMELDCGELQ